MSLYMSFEEIADRVTGGEFVIDVNMEMEYKGHTIIVDSENGDNPFMEPETCSRGLYRKVCVVPPDDYKWCATFWTIDEAKAAIDIWTDES